MHLTRHTDYALRLLIYLTSSGDRLVSIAEVAQSQDISRTHLMKIANLLSHHGFIDATRGRGGGIRLAREPERINLDDVIQTTEPGCALVDCAGCQLTRRCRLPGIFDKAHTAFRDVLAQYSLADLVRERGSAGLPVV
ncbi:MAG: Rrf2 family transcriptional regulator [Novosphingobium sp.]|nr:Rrf2 family transcriptional regulator [Novosphingobium sp.]